MDTRDTILKFARDGRHHLNRGEKIRAATWAVFSFGALALLAEVPFILSGRRVPLLILCVPLVLAAGVVLGYYLGFRYSHRRAVSHMDHFFGLKEGLVTADEHIREGRDDEIHELQLKHTEQALRPHCPSRLDAPFPRKLFVSSMFLILISGGLLFVEDSMAVKQARAEEELVLELSKSLAEDMQQALDEMLDREDVHVAELLEDQSLKQMVAEFEAGADRKAVMRKLSEIDRHLARMQSELDTRADENYLMELARNLSQSAETAAVGQALSDRDYKAAGEELEKMQLGEGAGQEQRRALEKLAAQIAETEKSMSSNPSTSRQKAQAMSRQIRKMSEETKRSGRCSQESRNAVNRSVSENSRSMQQLATRRQAQSALDRLRKQLQQGQNRMAGKGRQPGGDRSGGQQAGDGVDRSRRPPGTTSASEGVLEHLSGQLGEGESERMVEDAASGTGVTSREGIEKATADYQQQMEAFVRRDDIPEEMKHGVKTYFEQIHALEQQEIRRSGEDL